MEEIDKKLLFDGKSIRNEKYTLKEKIGAKGEGPVGVFKKDWSI